MGYERNKKTFSTRTYEIICNHTNIKFLTWPHELQKDLAASRKFSCSHLVEELFLHFPLS